MTWRKRSSGTLKRLRWHKAGREMDKEDFSFFTSTLHSTKRNNYSDLSVDEHSFLDSCDCVNLLFGNVVRHVISERMWIWKNLYDAVCKNNTGLGSRTEQRIEVFLNKGKPFREEKTIHWKKGRGRFPECFSTKISEVGKIKKFFSASTTSQRKAKGEKWPGKKVIKPKAHFFDWGTAHFSRKTKLTRGACPTRVQSCGRNEKKPDVFFLKRFYDVGRRFFKKIMQMECEV